MASVYSWLSAFFGSCQLLSVLLVWLLLTVPRVVGQNRSDDAAILLKFKKAYSDSREDPSNSNYWSTWKEGDENPCSWIGVTCTSNSTVSELHLSGWRFETQSVDVGMLSKLADLRQLDLSNNSPFDMPSGIGNLTGLTLLDLSQNHIDGTIPQSISACRRLRFLYLQENFLHGEISSLSGLVSLQILVLAGNQFSGPFPKELGELSRLVNLDLSGNFFNDGIPALPRLSNLVDLKLDNNSFTGFEKNWLLGPGGANASLQRLTVSFNQLQGTIPSSITNLFNLQILNMSSNRLSGSIPFGFSRQLQHWFSLDLSQNNLTGDIPYDVLQQSDNESCAILNLSYNRFTGTVPIDVSKHFCFETLDISHNNLSGPWIPADIFVSDFKNKIDVLLLQGNQISGDIIDVLVESAINWEIVELQLQDNLFTGDLSRIVSTSKGQIELLEVLDLSNNRLRWSTSDLIPDPVQATLERLTTSSPNLSEFRVGGNNFSGVSLPKTCFLNQSDSGPHGLTVLDLSNSQLSGEIFSAAFDSSCLPYLVFLNLSHNDITGPVPNSIVMLPNLAVLDVSHNYLSGPLPAIPPSSSLHNISFFDGNPELCGYPLPSCPLPAKGVPWWVFFITIGGSLTLALISCLAATWRWRVYRRRHQQDADLIQTLVEKDSASLMPLRELRKATDNFAGKAQIGQGGFATVYKGKLNDGTIVAVKKSRREASEKEKKQFLNEVRILSQVSHPNLVKLIGCCLENKTAVLVFEFVSNGTLQEHLQGTIGVVRLTWTQRLNIAVQTADALNYLHSAATFPIYHRDVKSANILLNDDLNAKVADFGISRLAPLQATHVSTALLQGTVGYVDPEYYTSYQLTDRSDVFSFGVVLLELISAKPALDLLKVGLETSLVNLARPYIERGDLEGLIDPALTEYYNDLDGHGRDSILSVGRLTMMCAHMRAKARPSMNEVLKELQHLWAKLTGTSTDIPSFETDSNREGAQHDYNVLLSAAFSGDSSSFAVQGSGDYGVQMTHLGPSATVEEILKG